MSTYPGGKAGAGVWQRIICEIPPHDTWISCFAGHCAVTRHLAPARRVIVIDKDTDVMDWWKQFDVERHCCDSVAWLRHEFGLFRLPSSLGTSAVPGGELRGDLRTYQAAGSTIAATAAAVAGNRDWRSPVARNVGGGPSCKPGVVDGSGDESSWRRRTVRRSSAFVYADPPYPISSRRKNAQIYAHEMTDQQHVELLEVLGSLPCDVLIHSYPSDLYCQALHGWRTWTYKAMTRGGMAVEQVWCNYPPPAALHDYRWLGRSKREREKLARRRRNLIRWLADLPQFERAQLLAAVAAEFGGPGQVADHADPTLHVVTACHTAAAGRVAGNSDWRSTVARNVGR